MTWALQPCDVYVMAGHKRCLTNLWSNVLSRKGRDALCITEVLRCVNDATVQHIKNRDWASSFTHLGLVGHQELVAWSLLDKVNMPEVLRASSDLPLLAHLQEVFPRRQNLPLEEMFALYM